MLSLKTWCCGKPVKPLLWDSTCVSLHCSAALSALREIWWLYSKCTYLSWCSCKDRNDWERWRAAKGSKPQRERKGWETERGFCVHVTSALLQLNYRTDTQRGNFIMSYRCLHREEEEGDSCCCLTRQGLRLFRNEHDQNMPQCRFLRKVRRCIKADMGKNTCFLKWKVKGRRMKYF